MRSIDAIFNRIQRKQPNLGAYICLTQAVREKKFTQDSIARAFTRLVPKDQYFPLERKALLRFLTNVSNSLEDNDLESKNAPQ